MQVTLTGSPGPQQSICYSHVWSMEMPQWPHVDYSWKVLLIYSRRRHGFQVDQGSKGDLKHGCMPYTLYMPLTPDGSYPYIWFGQDLSCPIHIRYGHILCLRGDVVHWRALPTLPNGVDHARNKYEHLHFYFPTNAVDLPDNNIFCQYYLFIFGFLNIGVPVTGPGTTSNHCESMIANIGSACGSGSPVLVSSGTSKQWHSMNCSLSGSAGDEMPMPMLQ